VTLRYSSALQRWTRLDKSQLLYRVGARSQVTLPSSGAAVQNMGMHTTTITATLSNLSPVATPTNDFDEYSRFQVTNSTASGTSAVFANPLVFMRGATAGRQGFFHTGRVRFSAMGATGAVFAGMTASTAAITTLPSAQTNVLLIGAETTQTTLRIFCRDGSAGTPIDLGANFPALSASYEYCFYAPPGSSFVRYMVRRLDTRFVAEGSLTANLPVNTQALAHRVAVMVGATAAANTAQAAFLLTQGL
jgi:hypothetical protein